MKLVNNTYKKLLKNNFELYSNLRKENNSNLKLIITQYQDILDDIFYGVPKDKVFIEMFEESLNKIIYNDEMSFSIDYKKEVILYAKHILCSEFEKEDIVRHVNSQVCSQCKGSCCKIYASPEHGGTFDTNEYWESWVANFHKTGDTSGVTPLYDANFIHLACTALDGEEHNGIVYDYEKESKKLKDIGIDVSYCQYKGSNGCLIPIEKRPTQCLKFTCRKLRCFDENYREEIIKVNSKNPRFIDEKWINFLEDFKNYKKEQEKFTEEIIFSL